MYKMKRQRLEPNFTWRCTLCQPKPVCSSIFDQSYIIPTTLLTHLILPLNFSLWLSYKLALSPSWPFILWQNARQQKRNLTATLANAKSGTVLPSSLFKFVFFACLFLLGKSLCGRTTMALVTVVRQYLGKVVFGKDSTRRILLALRVHRHTSSKEGSAGLKTAGVILVALTDGSSTCGHIDMSDRKS